MSLHAITLGFSDGTTGTTNTNPDAWYSYSLPASTEVPILQNLGANAVAIAGRQFIVDTSFEPYRREAFRHKSLQAQRQSVNFTNIMGEATVNTEGLWRRGQNDWSAGAGQKYLDRKDSQMPNRFYSSLGIDVFSQDMQATVLNDTTKFRSSVNTNLQVVRSDGYLFMIDGNAVIYTPVVNTGAYSTFTTLTKPSGVSTYYSICSTDNNIFVATDNGIWYYPLSNIGSSLAFSQWCGNDSGTGFTGFNLVRWCNERLVAASGNYLYMFSNGHTPGSTAPSSSQDLLMKHSITNWVWTDATGGSSQIYFTGYAKQNSDSVGLSAVYRSGIPTTTGNTAWVPNYPVQALPLPSGEAAFSIQSYLNFIFVGTNKGIRMAQTLSVYDPTATNNGDLKAGAFVPNLTQPVTKPVRSIMGNGSFVYFGWSNYDAAHTGLGKLSLDTFINGDMLAPAYASDLMARGANGEVLSITYDSYNSLPVFAVSGVGFFVENASQKLPYGQLTSGAFTYGIPDHKTPVYFDYGIDFAANGNGASAQITTEPFDPSSTATLNIDAATDDVNSEKFIPAGSSYKAETFQTTITLQGGATMYRWTLKAWPTVVSETSIMVPLQLFSVNVVDGAEIFVDPYEQFMFLEDLRQTQQIVTYQEGSLQANVIIESLDFLPHKRRGGYENGFEGDCVVSLKTIGGYQPYTGIPTN